MKVWLLVDFSSSVGKGMLTKKITKMVAFMMIQYQCQYRCPAVAEPVHDRTCEKYTNEDAALSGLEECALPLESEWRSSLPHL